MAPWATAAVPLEGGPGATHSGSASHLRRTGRKSRCGALGKCAAPPFSLRPAPGATHFSPVRISRNWPETNPIQRTGTVAKVRGTYSTPNAIILTSPEWQLHNGGLAGYNVAAMIEVRARHTKSQVLRGAGLDQQSGASCTARQAQCVAGVQCMQQSGRCLPP